MTPQQKADLADALERYDALRMGLGVSAPGVCLFWRETMSSDVAIAVYADGVGGAWWVCMDDPNPNPTSDDCLVRDSSQGGLTEEEACEQARAYWREHFGGDEEEE